MRIALAIFLACLVLLPTNANACGTPLPWRAAEIHREQAQFLDNETDKEIVGVWRLQSEEDDDDAGYWRIGYVEILVENRAYRYRFQLPMIINCGFPNYYFSDGDRGRFYLKLEEDPDPDDLADGFIDDYKFVHFESEQEE